MQPVCEIEGCIRPRQQGRRVCRECFEHAAYLELRTRDVEPAMSTRREQIAGKQDKRLRRKAKR